MKNIILTLKEPQINPNIPIEAENISPDIFANKMLSEIRDLTTYRGNREVKFHESFIIEGTDLLNTSPTEIEIILKGNFEKYKRIGQNMTNGKIMIYGRVGMHLGEQMRGGTIIVEGDVHDFVGANMSGGEIHIKGNAGHYLGGSIRGDWRGMNGGKIIVEGNIKNESGIWMRNGLIEVKGNAAMFLGMHMHRGLIIVHGNVTERAGAEMTGGTIIILGKLIKNLPSFEFVQEVIDLNLEEYGTIKGTFMEYHGDFAERKQGVLYVLKSVNKHLLE